MPIVTPTLTAAESVPGGIESPWDLSRLLIANWSRSIEVTNSWPVVIGSTGSAAEKRVVPSGKPLRTLRFSVQSTRATESWLLRNFVRRMAISRSLVPLWPDHTRLTADSSGATLTCDVTLRRIFPGARVAIAAPFAGGVAYQRFESAVVQSAAGTTLTLTAPPSLTYSAGSRVVPLLECELLLESTPRNLGGGRLLFELLASEVPGANALPPLASAGDTIAFGSYGGYPVFDPGFNAKIGWRADSDGWRRDAISTTVGLGSVRLLFGSRPAATSSRSAEAIGRAEAWALLRFWDVCRGPAFPFFAPSPLPSLNAVAITTTTVQVGAAGPLEDWNDYPYLAVVKRQADSGAARVRPIRSVSRAGGVDTILLEDALDAMTLQQVAYVAPASLMRFDGPDLTEKWTNSRRLSLAFSLIEVLNEKTVTLANL